MVVKSFRTSSASAKIHEVHHSKIDVAAFISGNLGFQHLPVTNSVAPRTAQ